MNRLAAYLALAGVLSGTGSWWLAGWRGAVCWLLGLLAFALALGAGLYAMSVEDRG